MAAIMSDADAHAIRSALLSWQADGVANPKIAVGRDVDGDGVDDFYGLDAFGNLTLLPGVTVEDTVSVSTGVEGF